MKYIDTIKALLPENLREQYVKHIRLCVDSVLISKRVNKGENPLWKEMDEAILSEIYVRIKARLSWVQEYFPEYEGLFIHSGLFWAELTRKIGPEVWGFVQVQDKRRNGNG